MNALDEYFLMVVFTLLLNRVNVFTYFMFNSNREKWQGRVWNISIVTSVVWTLRIQPVLPPHISPCTFTRAHAHLADNDTKYRARQMCWGFRLASYFSSLMLFQLLGDSWRCYWGHNRSRKRTCSVEGKMYFLVITTYCAKSDIVQLLEKGKRCAVYSHVFFQLHKTQVSYFSTRTSVGITSHHHS